MVVTGDASQSDLPGGRAEGLNEALTILDGVEGVATARFSDKDVVRHPLVGRIVRAYDGQARDGELPARYRKGGE
jgi:phosphate starvation-inducible PhoH-like protein